MLAGRTRCTSAPSVCNAFTFSSATSSGIMIAFQGGKQARPPACGTQLTRVITPANDIAIRINDGRDKGDSSVTWLSISLLLKSQWIRRSPQRFGNRCAGATILVVQHPRSLLLTRKPSEVVDAYSEKSHFAKQPDPSRYPPDSETGYVPNSVIPFGQDTGSPTSAFPRISTPSKSLNELILTNGVFPDPSNVCVDNRPPMTWHQEKETHQSVQSLRVQFHRSSAQ